MRRASSIDPACFLILVLMLLVGCDSREPAPSSGPPERDREAMPTSSRASPPEPIVRIPIPVPQDAPFRRPPPIVPEADIAMVTIDAIPSNDEVPSWRLNEADVRRMIRTYDEVDETTWGMTNSTFGERRGTLRLVDGRTIGWRWIRGGLVTLSFPDGKTAFLVAGRPAFRSETRSK